MNHYDVLEVSPKASAEVIRAAYKSLMQRYHPDKNPDLADPEKNASRIAQAYEVLGNADRRAAYDSELETAHDLPARVYGTAATYGRRQAAPDKRSWFAWLLIAFIIAAGALILLLSRTRQASAPGGQDAPLAASGSLQRGSGAAAADAPGSAATASGPGGESLADRQARTIASFATSLSIDLVPAEGAAAGTPHTLRIPEFGLRVDAPEPLRWVKKIETQREELISQLLARLSTADYEQLIRADGELYLKRLIADTVVEGIAYEQLSPPPPLPESGIGPPPRRPVAVVLPQSFTVR